MNGESILRNRMPFPNDIYVIFGFNLRFLRGHDGYLELESNVVYSALATRKLRMLNRF